MGDRRCNLTAMVDTGSPVSFVKYNVYLKEIEPLGYSLVASERKFVNIKSLPLDVIGMVTVDLTLRLLKNKKMTVQLYVIRDQAFASDFIFGREFILQEKLTLIYRLHEAQSDDRIDTVTLFEQLPLDVEEYVATDLKNKLKDCEIDFDNTIKENLIELITEVENRAVEKIDDNYKVSVRLKDDSIYAYAPRRFAYAEKMELRRIVDDLISRDIIKPSVSPYCARVVPVRKRNGEMRMCVDLRPLNARVIKQKYPFPIIEDCLSRLAGKKIFTLLDLKEGFHQIKVDDDSMKYFSFATPDGQYEFKRLPFGFSEAPAEFQKRIIQVLNPLIREEKILVYIDDVLIPSRTVEENLETLEKVLVLLKQYGFQLNYDKCLFLRIKIEFLGYIVSANGMTLSPRHTEAVRQFKSPENVTEVQRFLGLASYFRKFIKDFAIKARPLHLLLRKGVAFDFGKECLESFETLKSELTSAPVLALYDPTAETELHTDASSVGLGAMLLQKQQSGLWAAVAFFSKATNHAESKYHSFELEMLAVVRAVERFHLYLYGLDFAVVTDCNALVYAVNKANLNPRIARWTLTLQNYNFRVVHRPGDRMRHVDALSRAVAYVNELPLERELEFRQLADPRIREISNDLEVNESDRFALVNGLVYRKDGESLKFVVPDTMVTSVLRAHHDDMAHCGWEKTYQGIAQNYWFPSMRKKIHVYIENCFACLMANESNNRFEGETSLYPVPCRAVEVLHLDHFGPLPETADHYKHVFIVVDAFTRFTWLYPVRTTSSREVIKCLTGLFATFGRPENIVTDRGTAFTSQEFSVFLDKLNISHRKVAVASPWANGTVERVNRFMKNSLVKSADYAEAWKTILDTVQYVINNTYHSVVKTTPAKLMFGFDQRNHRDHAFAQFVKILTDSDASIEMERDSVRNTAKTATELIRAYNKKYKDAHTRKPSVYDKGDYVLIRNLSVKAGENSKLKPNYRGPYMIAKCLGNNRYVVRDIPGFNITTRPYNSILSADKIKSWIKPVRRTEGVDPAENKVVN